MPYKKSTIVQLTPPGSVPRAQRQQQQPGQQRTWRNMGGGALSLATPATAASQKRYTAQSAQPTETRRVKFRRPRSRQYSNGSHRARGRSILQREQGGDTETAANGIVQIPGTCSAQPSFYNSPPSQPGLPAVPASFSSSPFSQPQRNSALIEGPDDMHSEPEPSSHRRSSSIQLLGPPRHVVLRMSMNEKLSVPSAALVPRVPGKPAPIGVYEPVEKDILAEHPEKFTSDGLRRKERMYRLYDHGNWHLFRGRVITGSRPLPFISAICMIVTPVVLFSIFVCPYLWTDLHKAPVIVFIYLTALTLTSMMKASFSDPGIIPRNLDAITAPDNYAIDVGNHAQQHQQHQQSWSVLGGESHHATSSTATDRIGHHHPYASPQPLQYYEKLPPPWVHIGHAGRRDGPLSVYDPKIQGRPASDPYLMFPPTTKLVAVNNVAVRLKYCETCKIYRPPRASHCKYCDNCVENEDHHCIWLNNCVGRRNYRYFYGFVGALTFLCLYIVAFCLVRLILPLHHEPGLSFRQSVKRHPVVLAVLIFAFWNVWLVGGLFGYHTILISRNMTTHEVLGAKHSGAYRTPAGATGKRHLLFPKIVSPYSRGSCASNWAAALCNPAVPANVKWRTRVDPEGIEELLPRHSQP